MSARRLRWMGLGTIAWMAAMTAMAAPPDESDGGLEPATPEARVVERPGVAHPAASHGIGDYHLAAWLIVDQGQALDIFEFGAKHAASDQVQQFATKAADDHRNFVAKLHAAGLAAVERGEPQIGTTLRKVAKELRDNPSGAKKVVVGFRGVGDRNDNAATDEPQRDEPAPAKTAPRIRVELKKSDDDSARENRDARREDRRADADRRDDRLDRREAREERREDVRDERADLRSDRRESARDFIRQALPALRDNLPEILDIVGEAIDDSTQSNEQRAFIALQQQVANRHADSVKQELGKQDGRAFDHAFLHYEILAHMQMIDTMEVLKQHATAEFRPTIEEGLASSKSHLDEARRLLDQIQQPSAKESQ